MSTYDWPASLEPAACTLMLEPNVREFISPYTGAYEVVDLVGERWRMQLSFPDALRATAAAQEAFLNRLRGIHLVRAPYFDRPEPLGTLRGSPVLSASAAQGATSLSIKAAATVNNLFTGPIDLRASAWTATSTTASADTTVAPDGLAECTALAFAGVGDASMIQEAGAARAGMPYTISVYLMGTGTVSVGVRDAAATYTAETSFTLTGAWVRRSVTVTMGASPSGAVKGFVIRRGTDTATACKVWGVQVQPAASATTFDGRATLLAGDMLQAGTHLFQVAADTTFDGKGEASVPVVNRARSTIASATALTWQRPTAVYRLQGTPRIVHAGGSARLQDIDLVESF